MTGCVVCSTQVERIFCDENTVQSLKDLLILSGEVHAASNALRYRLMGSTPTNGGGKVETSAPEPIGFFGEAGRLIEEIKAVMIDTKNNIERSV